jgi:hypothetical protein
MIERLSLAFSRFIVAALAIDVVLALSFNGNVAMRTSLLVASAVLLGTLALVGTTSLAYVFVRIVRER